LDCRRWALTLVNADLVQRRRAEAWMADVRDVVPSTLVGMAQTVNVPYALANCCGARVVNVSGASLDCAHQLAAYGAGEGDACFPKTYGRPVGDCERL